MTINEKIDKLIEKYLGLYHSGVEVFTNPTILDIKEMKKWSEIRFLINVDTDTCYVWDSQRAIHQEIFNSLLSKHEFTGDRANSFAEVYNRPDIIAGYAKLEGNKMAVRFAYGNDVDPDSVKSGVKKLFKNPNELFANAATPHEYR